MRVSIYVGETETVLAHGSTLGVGNHVGPGEDLRGSLRAASQTDEVIDADEVTIAGRGNKSGNLSFSVEVQLGSVEAATVYALTFPATCPRAGEIRFVEADKVISMPGAHIDDIAFFQRGISVSFTFQIHIAAVVEVVE